MSGLEILAKSLEDRFSAHRADVVLFNPHFDALVVEHVHLAAVELGDQLRVLQNFMGLAAEVVQADGAVTNIRRHLFVVGLLMTSEPDL